MVGIERGGNAEPCAVMILRDNAPHGNGGGAREPVAGGIPAHEDVGAVAAGRLSAYEYAESRGGAIWLSGIRRKGDFAGGGKPLENQSPMAELISGITGRNVGRVKRGRRAWILTSDSVHWIAWNSSARWKIDTKWI